MENARVVIFEDNPSFRSLLGIFLEGREHSVVAEADTKEGADKLTDLLAAGKITADVAVVDGNLSRGEVDGSEGADIVQKLRRAAGAMAIYGISNMGRVEGVDENVSKGEINILLELIDRLPEPGRAHTEAA